MEGIPWQDWLTTFGGSRVSEFGTLPLVLMMAVSLLSSLFILLLYVTFYRTRATGSMVHLAFPLLGPSITAVFICIQFSLPLSLGLLGALSIVRFRSPIKEPEEVGFIMFVVAASLCCATFNILFLGVILATGVVALALLRWNPRIVKGQMNDGMVVITAPTRDIAEKRESLLELLDQQIAKGRVESILDNGDESVLSYSFFRLKEQGVPDVSQIKAICPAARCDVFFNRSGDI
jgi:hypothetical protein